jgi:hypothetical protein
MSDDHVDGDPRVRQEIRAGRDAYVAARDLTVIHQYAPDAGRQAPSVFRRVRRKREQREQQARITREACVDLLSTVSELRTSVRNAIDYHGPEMHARLEKVHNYAASAQAQAAKVALLAPRALADPAERLATAASNLAELTARCTELFLGVMVSVPDFAEIDERAASFKQIAMEHVGQW